VSQGQLSPDSSSQISRNPIFTKLLSHTPIESPGTFSPKIEPPSDNDEPNLEPPIQFDGEIVNKSSTASIAESTYKGVELDEFLPRDEMSDRHVGLLLRRRNSYTRFQQSTLESRHNAYWPRHGSFSIAEDSLHKWESINQPVENEMTQASDTKKLAQLGELTAEEARRVRGQLVDVESVVSRWVSEEVMGIQSLDNLIDLDQEELNGLYYPRLEEYQGLRTNSKEMLDMEREQLSEAIKEIEDLGLKLEYEINTLRSKVEDVEDGVTEFERQVFAVENRVAEMERDMRPKESWMHWFVRLTTGIGNAPSESVATAK
jgi:hypothetical protein